MSIEMKELCFEFLASETSKEIESILNKHNLQLDSNAWIVFGNKPNNYSIIGNQKADPVDALIEKFVNSVDAVLMRECYLKGYHPESPKAPKSITAALEEFFKIKNGNLVNVDAINRTLLAQNIGFVATGKKSLPNYLIFDKGEGQTPKMMPKTFLSLSESNKQKIPFVQGKYNQGGTGVLRFCGENGYQLIISKRHPDIKDKDDDTKDLWGFTLVRREDPSGGKRNSTYTYLSPNGEIPSFSSDEIQIKTKHSGTQEISSLKWGAIIKLYEYEMSSGLKTNILFDLYNQVSLLLPRIGIPIRFYERRDYKGHSLETTLSGLGVRLEDDKRDNLEQGFPGHFDFTVDNEKFRSSIFAFQKGQAKKYRRREGVIFTYHGQAHGSLSDNIFKGSVGMGYLADSLLVLVNCDEISLRAQEKLFLTSRDRLSKGKLWKSIENELKNQIKNHQGLKELRERRRREAIEDKLSDSKPLQEIINDVIKKSPGLQSLFRVGADIKNPFKSRLVDEKDEFNGKLHPSYFYLTSGQKNKVCHINQRFRVQFETDVENNYFHRDRYPGSYCLFINGEQISNENYVLNLWNGSATLTIALPSDTKEGGIIKGKLSVIDETLINPLENEFERHVKGPVNSSSGKSSTRKPPAGNGKGDRKISENLSLPNVYEIREHEWNDRGFDRFSNLQVIEDGKGKFDFFINMDNVYLRTELKKINKPDEAKLSEARFKFGVVLLGLTLLKDRESFSSNEEDDEGYQPIDDLIFQITKSIAPVILPMIDVLGELSLNKNDLD